MSANLEEYFKRKKETISSVEKLLKSLDYRSTINSFDADKLRARIRARKINLLAECGKINAKKIQSSLHERMTYIQKYTACKNVHIIASNHKSHSWNDRKDHFLITRSIMRASIENNRKMYSKILRSDFRSQDQLLAERKNLVGCRYPILSIGNEFKTLHYSLPEGAFDCQNQLCQVALNQSKRIRKLVTLLQSAMKLLSVQGENARRSRKLSNLNDLLSKIPSRQARSYSSLSFRCMRSVSELFTTKSRRMLRFLCFLQSNKKTKKLFAQKIKEPFITRRRNLNNISQSIFSSRNDSKGRYGYPESVYMCKNQLRQVFLNQSKRVRKLAGYLKIAMNLLCLQGKNLCRNQKLTTVNEFLSNTPRQYFGAYSSLGLKHLRAVSKLFSSKSRRIIRLLYSIPLQRTMKDISANSVDRIETLSCLFQEHSATLLTDCSFSKRYNVVQSEKKFSRELIQIYGQLFKGYRKIAAQSLQLFSLKRASEFQSAIFSKLPVTLSNSGINLPAATSSIKKIFYLNARKQKLLSNSLSNSLTQNNQNLLRQSAIQELRRIESFNSISRNRSHHVEFSFLRGIFNDGLLFSNSSARRKTFLNRRYASIFLEQTRVNFHSINFIQRCLILNTEIATLRRKLLHSSSRLNNLRLILISLSSPNVQRFPEDSRYRNPLKLKTLINNMKEMMTAWRSLSLRVHLRPISTLRSKELSTEKATIDSIIAFAKLLLQFRRKITILMNSVSPHVQRPLNSMYSFPAPIHALNTNLKESKFSPNTNVDCTLLKTILIQNLRRNTVSNSTIKAILSRKQNPDRQNEQKEYFNHLNSDSLACLLSKRIQFGKSKQETILIDELSLKISKLKHLFGQTIQEKQTVKIDTVERIRLFLRCIPNLQSLLSKVSERNNLLSSIIDGLVFALQSQEDELCKLRKFARGVISEIPEPKVLDNYQRILKDDDECIDTKPSSERINPPKCGSCKVQ